MCLKYRHLNRERRERKECLNGDTYTHTLQNSFRKFILELNFERQIGITYYVNIWGKQERHTRISCILFRMKKNDKLEGFEVDVFRMGE